MRIGIIFLLCFLLIPISLAAPTLEIQNQKIQPGETILAKLTTTGEFTEKITKSQIKFLDGRKETSLETAVFLYNNTQYISIYTSQEKNLTLKIENILYKEEGSLKSYTISQNLTIRKSPIFNEETNETFTKILRVRPGFISSSTPKIRLTNIGNSSLNITCQDQELSISPLTTKEISINPKAKFSLITISSYEDFQIPVLYLSQFSNGTINQSETGEDNSTPIKQANLRYESNLSKITIQLEEELEKTIELFNVGKENITDIKIMSSSNFISTSTLQDMPSKQVQNLTISLFPKEAGFFQETINISYVQNETGFTLKIPIEILVLPNGTTKENFTRTQGLKCEDIGQVCESGEVCNGTAVFTDEYKKFCCPFSCIPAEGSSEESGSLSWIVGFLILAVLGYTGYYFYNKQKSLKNPTAKDSMSTISQKLENKMLGNKV